MILLRFSLLLLGFSILVAGCDKTSDSIPFPSEALALLNVSADECADFDYSIHSAVNEFNFLMLDQIRAVAENPDESVFFSALSLNYALMMTANGAGGSTRQGILNAQQFDKSSLDDLNQEFYCYHQQLESLDPTTTVNIANSIWYRDELTINPEFAQAVEAVYEAEIEAADFDDEETTLAAVNGWVDDKTEGLIPTILNRIGSDDVMYLINAIYFKGEWQTSFDPENTYETNFNAYDGSVQSCQMMTKSDSVGYRLADDQTKVVQLPYGNGQFVMNLFLPASDTDINDWVDELTAEQYDDLLSQLATEEVDVHHPKLRMAYEVSLNEPLINLGMGEAFNRGADFSNLFAEDLPLSIGFVKQKTFVEIDEVGTEAAAVTAVGIEVTSAEPSPNIVLNRPYFFTIAERENGAILFAGKVMAMPEE